jgi:hypothetical protein
VEVVRRSKMNATFSTILSTFWTSDVKFYPLFLQAKDESLVRLTNQLHETELSNVMLAATVSNLTSR